MRAAAKQETKKKVIIIYGDEINNNGRMCFGGPRGYIRRGGT